MVLILLTFQSLSSHLRLRADSRLTLRLFLPLHHLPRNYRPVTFAAGDDYGCLGVDSHIEAPRVHCLGVDGDIEATRWVVVVGLRGGSTPRNQALGRGRGLLGVEDPPVAVLGVVHKSVRGLVEDYGQDVVEAVDNGQGVVGAVEDHEQDVVEAVE